MGQCNLNGLIKGLFAGIVLGAAAGLLLSPSSGRENRKYITAKYEEFADWLEEECEKAKS